MWQRLDQSAATLRTSLQLSKMATAQNFTSNETAWTIEAGHWRSFKLEAVETAMAELRYCRRHPKRISLAGVY